MLQTLSCDELISTGGWENIPESNDERGVGDLDDEKGVDDLDDEWGVDEMKVGEIGWEEATNFFFAKGFLFLERSSSSSSTMFVGDFSCCDLLETITWITIGGKLCKTSFLFFWQINLSCSKKPNNEGVRDQGFSSNSI
jgi:hypothetical protein